MTITLKKVEHTKNGSVNLTHYSIEHHSQLSTKEIIITVNHESNEITGECVAYGSWIDLEFNECIEYLEQINVKK